MTWADVPGVVVFPDGTRVRGRGLRAGLPPGEVPDLGVYLLGREPPPAAWESWWIPWPNFRLPRDRAAALSTLRAALDEAGAGRRVEVACGGGRGRTGTALACLAVFTGVPADEAVDWVRANYRSGAVETWFQRRFVNTLAP